MSTTASFKNILIASKNVYQYLSPTPLRYYQQLSDILAAKVWLKHENYNPTCAFKVRGGLNFVAQLSNKQKQAGLYTASTGNHGQSIAYSAYVNNCKATIYVPKGANPGKVAAIQAYGAKVIYYGDNFDMAREKALQDCQQNNATFVSPTDDILINGVGSYALEIMQDLPDVDVIIVPVGAGSGICATAIVAKTINPNIRIIGVQSAQAPAQQISWQNRQLIKADNTTIAEGVATGVPFINTQKIMWKYVDEFILVDDAEIIAANKVLIATTHSLIEEASAASFAAALKIKPQLKTKKVVLIMSGGNISMQNLSRYFA